MVTVDFKPTVERYKKQILHEPASIAIIVIRTALTVYLLRFLMSENGRAVLHSSFWLVYLIFVVLDVVMLINLGYMLMSAKVIYKRLTDFCPDRSIRLSFNDDRLIAEENGTNITTRDEFSYDKLGSAVYDKGWFYLRVNTRNLQYTFSADEIGSGGEIELKSLLMNKLGNKFRMKG